MPRIEQLLAGEIDWAYLIGMALRHGVGSLLHRALECTQTDAVPIEIRRGLAQHSGINRERTRILVTALHEILEALRTEGIEALPFKGPALAAVAYGDVDLRLAGDLDLLLRETDVDEACAVLRGRGFRDVGEFHGGRLLTDRENNLYRRYQCEYAFFRETDRVTVEPHWAVAPRTMSVMLDYGAVWSRATTIELGGRRVRALSWPDLLLFVCVHGGKHQWKSLRWVCDVSQLMARIAPTTVDSVLSLARGQGVERFVLVGLGLAHNVLGTVLPSRVTAHLKSDPTALDLVREARSGLFQSDEGEHSPFNLSVFQIRMRERWRDRARYILRTAVTPTIKHIGMVSLPARLSFLYVPIKLGHDYAALPLWRFGKTVGHEARRVLRRLSAVQRVLVIDWVPSVLEGAGFPRTLAILRALDNEGIPSTVYPPDPYVGSDAQRDGELPRSVEVVGGHGLDTLDAFLAERRGEFKAVIVCRPMTMARFVALLARKPDLRSGFRLIYDSEALFAAREVLRRRLLGEPLDEQAEVEMLKQEVSLALAADVVLAVSDQERVTFRRFGAEDVRLLAYAVTPSPTPREFSDRSGLLFVGRVVEDRWPNADSLVWFRDEVFPIVRERLARLGHNVSLEVAGRTGASTLASPSVAGVRFLGPVVDLNPLYDATRLFIAPTRFAAGIPIKVLEAAAHGVPVVATALLARQLGWRNGEELLASEVSDAEGFAANIVAAYTHPELWSRLRRGALTRIEHDSSPERFRNVLVGAIRGLEQE